MVRHNGQHHDRPARLVRPDDPEPEDRSWWHDLPLLAGLRPGPGVRRRGAGAAPGRRPGDRRRAGPPAAPADHRRAGAAGTGPARSRSSATSTASPSSTATRMDDLMRAQGFVHAQERFFEMDVRRHVTAGRLSELFGEDRRRDRQVHPHHGLAPGRRAGAGAARARHPRRPRGLRRRRQRLPRRARHRASSAVEYTVLRAGGLDYRARAVDDRSTRWPGSRRWPGTCAAT